MKDTSQPSEESSLIDLNTDLVKDLLRSDGNFRALVELLPASLMIHRGGKILYANPGWLRLLGYDHADELVGRSPLEIVHPDYRQAVQERIGRIGQGQPGTPLEEQVLVCKNGEALPVEAQGIAVVYGGVPAVMVVAKDISSRKKAQVALRASEENFRAMIEKMPDGMIVSIEARIVFANFAIARLLKFERPQDLVGLSIFDVMHPDDRNLIQRRVRFLEDGVSRNPLVEERMLARDGSVVPVMASSFSTLFEGKKAVMAIVRDVTEYKKSREELEESHQLLERAQRAGHIGIWTADLKIGGKVFWSDESYAIFGVSKDRFGGKAEDFFGIIHPDDLERVRKAADSAVQEGPGYNIEFRIVRPEGTIRWVHGQAEVIRSKDGVPLKLIGTAQDITERKQVEESLRKTERLALLNDKLATIGTLAAGVTHEINNPLTYVLTNVQAVRDNLAGLRAALAKGNPVDPEVSALLEEIGEEIDDAVKGTGRIRDIVKGLKTFMHSGREELSGVNLNELADSAIGMVQHEIKHKAAIEKAYAADPPLLAANPGKLQQVLINLLVNALQAIWPGSADGNEIRVRTGWEGGNAFIEVEDTGEGIPAENIERIFEPFFTTKPAGVGTGIGLAICREIVQGYGGQIRVRSQVGKGSAFTVLLPARKGLAAAPGAVAPARPAGDQKGRALVVDDEPTNLETFGRMLRKNYEVLFASSGKEALETLEREGARFDVILSDVNMHGMDGAELHKAIARKYPGLERRMVFVTGGIFSMESRNYLSALPNPLLEKPFAAQELLEAVSRSVLKPVA